MPECYVTNHVTVSCSRFSKLLRNLAAPQGFEPRYADPESAVLPLNEGAAMCSPSNTRKREHYPDCIGCENGASTSLYIHACREIPMLRTCRRRAIR